PKASIMSPLFRLLWFNLFICVNTEERGFRVKLDEFSVRYKVRDLIEHIDFRIAQINNRSYVNGEMALKCVVRDIDMHTTMDFWKANNQNKIKLYDVRLDACEFLRTAHRNGLFNIYVKSFRKHTKADLNCPLKTVSPRHTFIYRNGTVLHYNDFPQNYNYSLRNWHMDEKDLPPYVPFGKFRTITEYFTQQRLALRIVTQGKVVIN
ncbi:hypothetical protein KR059_001214, partial [Drosophila kikkawai]